MRFFHKRNEGEILQSGINITRGHSLRKTGCAHIDIVYYSNEAVYDFNIYLRMKFWPFLKTRSYEEIRTGKFSFNASLYKGTLPV